MIGGHGTRNKKSGPQEWSLGAMLSAFKCVILFKLFVKCVNCCLYHYRKQKRKDTLHLTANRPRSVKIKVT
jgi:hypothetical protein